ncbi:TrkA C-terminal domain-containing protein [Brooklawnia sp.]|uniref:aspartate:alanine exchanger family transporter n=1 Tax=Brooklawnia sp. TaxID=2699740 RepID=UPI00311FAE8B
MLHLLADYPLLFLALLLLVGSLIGQISVAGASLGPAAVLFTAIGLTAWGITNGVELAIPEILGSFGLILFTYTVGLISGPNFFGSLRRGWPVMLTTLACLAFAALIAGIAARILGLSGPLAAGAFAGALTNTPSLAAASEAAGDAELPAVGYSISYLWGVIGMLLATAFALNRGKSAENRAVQKIEQRTIRVDTEDQVAVGELLDEYTGHLTITRMKHYREPVHVPGVYETLRRDDLFSAIGPADVLEAVTTRLGHTSSVDLIGDRSQLDSTRVTLSRSKLAGTPLSDLQLREKFGSHVTRVRRGDVDIIPTPDFVLQMGDRLRVVGPRDKTASIRTYLGDSERGFSDINPVGLALGLTAGLLIGMISIPLPTGAFSLGSAVGTLLSGLIMGRLGRIGRYPITMSTAAANSLSNLGMLVFIAYAGTKAGVAFPQAVSSSLGAKAAILGFIITVTAGVSLLLASRFIHHTDWTQLAGQLAGAQTQPALLAFANTRTGFDNRVSLGYTLVYPSAMFGKILLAQLLVLLA